MKVCFAMVVEINLKNIHLKYSKFFLVHPLFVMYGLLYDSLF